MADIWLILGILAGSLSPLLATAHLAQMKEWRWDRLVEHLRREGWARTIVRVLFRGILGKQRVPVWTAKAVLIVVTTLAITTMLTFSVSDNRSALLVAALPLILVQPVIVFAAWLLWKPLDWFVKQRLLRRAAARRSTLVNATVIGIVGSVGKTTTKELLKCVLQDLDPAATPEHINTELGVASWLLGVGATDRSPLLIVEMGAYRRGEIATLCRVAQPTIGVVTALGSDHLALFGSEEAIVETNAELLPTLPENGHLFLLGDNATTAGLKARASCPVTVAGTQQAENVRESERGLTFERNGTRFTIALHGAHNIGNAMLAIAVAQRLGIADERIRELLAGFRGSAHTFHVKKERGVTILDDTYNVSPLSFRAALAWASARPERPRVLLTSGLLETGSAETTFLHELGTLAHKSVERVIFTTESGANAFARTFGPVEILKNGTPPVSNDALLVCVGRMPLSTVQRLLPSNR